MALQRSLHQNHGFLPHASRPGGAAIGDLRWLPETQTMGRRVGRCHFHCAGRNRDDRSELALCSLWQASSSNERSLRAQAGCARHHRRGNYQTRARFDQKRVPCDSARRRVCRNAFRGNQLPADSSDRRITEPDRGARLCAAQKELRQLCR